MKAKIIVPILIFIVFINIFSCKKQIKVCLPTQLTSATMQGTWHQNYVGLLPPNVGFIAPPKFVFSFKKDSFKMSIYQISDIVGTGNPCSYGNWFEYATGTYSIVGAQLYLDGIYTESDYTIKTSGCYHTGKYLDTFKAQFCNDTMIVNWDKKSLIEIEKTNCKMYKD